MNFKEAYELIKMAEKICITTHSRPDGDAIGSAFAMWYMLKNMDKEAVVVMPAFSKKFNFLNEMQYVQRECQGHKCNLLICLDSPTADRLTIPQEEHKNFDKVLVVDHHKFSQITANVSLINDTAPATCEILYDFFQANNINITKEMADNLYMGIMTDTGSFNYERTTAKSHKIVAQLLELGADFVNICKWLNDTMSESKSYLMAYVIENMHSYYGGYLRISYASLEIQNKFGVEIEDAEGLTNYLRSIEGTEIAVYVREVEPKVYKASIRTNGAIDCSAIARKFGGGGHVRASGFDFFEFDETINKFIKIVGEMINGENNGDIKRR